MGRELLGKLGEESHLLPESHLSVLCHIFRIRVSHLSEAEGKSSSHLAGQANKRAKDLSLAVSLGDLCVRAGSGADRGLAGAGCHGCSVNASVRGDAAGSQRGPE